jgi:DNA-binding response OmpR family regulator
MRNERIVVSRQSLLEDVWSYYSFAETNTVDVFVSNLRRKLEAEGEGRMVHTVRGAGYVLRAS